jgi:hypothetical protein
MTSLTPSCSPFTTAFESLGRVMATGVYNLEEVRRLIYY